MKKELEIIIVGLSNYIDDYKDFVENLAKDTRVMMIPEPSNLFDKNAIKAFIGGKHIGYVARDMAPEVLPYVIQNRGVLIGTSVDAFAKEIHVVVDVSKFGDLPMKRDKEAVFDRETALSDNLIAPFLAEDEKFLMDLSLSEFYLQSGLTDEALKEALNDYLKGMHNSISCESSSRWQELSQKIFEIISGSQEPSLQKFKEDLEKQAHEMYEYNKDRVHLVGEIYKRKYKKLKQESQKEEGAVNRILKAEFGTTEPDQKEVKQLYDKMERFMLSLPNNTYRLLYQKPEEWAKALMYLRPTLKELYTICTHAIVLDWAKERMAETEERDFDIRDLSLAMIDREKVFNSKLDRDRLIHLYNRMKSLISGFNEKADYAWPFMACCNLNYLSQQNAYSAFAKTLGNWQVTSEDEKVVTNNIKINVKKMRDESFEPERMKQILKTIIDFENYIK